MKRIAALAFSVTVVFAQNQRPVPYSVTAIRNWSLAGVTRVAIEVSGDFQYLSDRLHNPERIYFDILNARPRIDSRRIYSQDVNDKLVLRIRAAETNPGVTRVVLELSAGVDVSVSQLSNPNRLMIELRGGTPAIPTDPPPFSLPAPPPVKPPSISAPSIKADLPGVAAPVVRPPVRTTKASAPGIPVAASIKEDVAKEVLAPVPELPRETARPPVIKTEPPVPVARPAAPPSPPTFAEFGKAARHTSSGKSSLTRALGLKVARVVIDPGHGGHDQGTQGPKGLVEKELVLDVALRVGKLIEEQMNAEVIYTRSEDTFIPLEGRTALANEKKADLFLSIHANSSSFTRIAGVETFYLNFTDSKDALDVAARENASSQKSIFELQDIIQKITMHEKLDESKEFAGRIQTALYSLSARNNPAQKNRGIKKAPFVVLIGANMPSVLAEIGFVSNPREEALLKRADYRQKLANSLYRGISKYAEGLSHFQMAQN
jgi:N-acetylmuramoyl-L-alanine amidase